MEEVFIDAPLFREFAQLGELVRLPGEFTILRFCLGLEKHKLAQQMLVTFNEHLTLRGLLLQACTIVDASRSRDVRRLSC